MFHFDHLVKRVLLKLFPQRLPFDEKTRFPRYGLKPGIPVVKKISFM